MITGRLAGGAAAVLAVAAIAGCTTSSSSSPPAAHRETSHATMRQWWSGTDYCDILRQTMRAGHSVLGATKAGDPALLVATKAFVADLTASAPKDVRAQWQVLGPALTQLVESGGKLTAVSGANSRAVAAAATAIATDAKTRCHVDVSA